MSEELTPMNHRELWLKAIATGTVPEWLEPMTHEELWLKAIAQGGGGLPPVTESDAGKVLGVNDSGVWGAQEPIGKKFIVTLTPTALDYSGTMDKTVAEINAAYEAGQEIWFKFYAGSDWTEYPLSRVGKVSRQAYPSFNCNALYDENNVLVMIYTGTTDSGTEQTYSTKIYTLTPAT